MTTEPTIASYDLNTDKFCITYISFGGEAVYDDISAELIAHLLGESDEPEAFIGRTL